MVPTETLYVHGAAFDNEAKAKEQPKEVIDFSSVEIRKADVTSEDLDLIDSLAACDEFDDKDYECILPEWSWSGLRIAARLRAEYISSLYLYIFYFTYLFFPHR